MNGFVSRFVVAQRHAVAADDLDRSGTVRGESLERWLAEACDAYVEKCSVLHDLAGREHGAVRVAPAVMPTAEGLRRPATVVVSAGATEFRPRSFTLAVRVRAAGGDDDVLMNLRYDVSVVDQTGEAVELDDSVRDELIALEHSASHFN
jgi:acyl-CoA thioesterase FadM